LREIGVQPEGRRTYELADGREAVMEIAVARIEFMGEVVGATVIFGDDDAEPLLGVTALASVGIEVDPQNQRLKRLPAVRLKSAARRPANQGV
jgi:clan AA aspartic protease